MNGLMHDCRWMGISAIALTLWLGHTPILRAEATLSPAVQDHQVVSSDLALTEMAAPARGEVDCSAAIECEFPAPADNVLDLRHPDLHLIGAPDHALSQVKPLSSTKQPPVEQHPPVDVAKGANETVRPHSRYESERDILEQSWLHSPDANNATHAEESLFSVSDNRAERLQPLNVADALQENETSSEAIPEDWPSPIDDNQVFWLVLVDELEYRFNDGTDALNWDVMAWVGGDYQRLWLKTEGEVGVAGDGSGEAELQLLYGQLVSPFWDFQTGLRYDRTFGAGRDRGRAFAVAGLQGLTPYLFEVDAALFISEDGDVSARFEAEYSLLLTQRLILQPELEVNIAAQPVEDFGVGSGFNDIELSLRLRYEVSRQFAPYVGVSWTRKFGQTADFAREDGESTDTFAVVGGLRLLF